jgi:hypothetical protein
MRRATGAEGVSVNGRCASPGSTRRSTRTPTDTDRTWGRRPARRTKSDPSRRSWSPCFSRGSTRIPFGVIGFAGFRCSGEGQTWTRNYRMPMHLTMNETEREP